MVGKEKLWRLCKWKLCYPETKTKTQTNQSKNSIQNTQQHTTFWWVLFYFVLFYFLSPVKTHLCRYYLMRLSQKYAYENIPEICLKYTGHEIVLLNYTVVLVTIKYSTKPSELLFISCLPRFVSTWSYRFIYTLHERMEK